MNPVECTKCGTMFDATGKYWGSWHCDASYEEGRAAEIHPRPLSGPPTKLRGFSSVETRMVQLLQEYPGEFPEDVAAEWRQLWHQWRQEA